MTAGAVLLRQRCDPYGAESRIRLLGGLYPDSRVSALALRMGFCGRVAEATYRMVCECEHRGQPMPLCGPGIMTGARGEAYPFKGHAAILSQRMSDLCPPCEFPPVVRELAEAMEARQADVYHAQRLGYLSAAAKLAQALEDMRAQMDEYETLGIKHKCPLHLIEVS